MSNLDQRTKQAIADGEAAWLKITSENWDESVWKTVGTALTLLRQQVLFDLGTNVARGSVYNTAFARRLDGTAFKSMDTVTRSNLLFVMEPANRVVLDRIMAEWTPDQRARRTHPTTLAKAIRSALRPPKSERQADRNQQGQAAKDGPPEIDSDALWASLPRSTQQRMEVWQRKRVQEMAASFHEASMQKAYEWLDAMGLPMWKRYVEGAQKTYDGRKRILDRATFIKIRAALNSASRNSITDKKLDEAFVAFTALEKYLLDEKDSPTNVPALPDSIDKWKRKVKTNPPKPAPGTDRRIG